MKSAAKHDMDRKKARAEDARRHALDKKRRAQLDALAGLERFLLDRVEVGLGSLESEDARGAEPLADLAVRMTDADLRGPHAALLRLAAEVEKEPSGERDRRIADAVTALWVLVRKGIKALEDPTVDPDPALETRLGRTWKRAELIARGWALRDVTLVELDDERAQDPILAMDVQRGHWLDLESGAIHLEWTGLPFFASRTMNPVLRRSLDGVIRLREAALDPGDAINRRIRWDTATEPASERPLHGDDLRAAGRHALTLEAALTRLRAQLSDPLAPRDAVFLLDIHAVGLVGSALVVQDARGARLVLRDPPGVTDGRSTVEHALAAFGPAPLATRLWFEPDAGAVFGQALTLLTAEQRVRLRA